MKLNFKNIDDFIDTLINEKLEFEDGSSIVTTAVARHFSHTGSILNVEFGSFLPRQEIDDDYPLEEEGYDDFYDKFIKPDGESRDDDEFNKPQSSGVGVARTSSWDEYDDDGY